MTYIKICSRCGKEFKCRNLNAKYCSDCRILAHKISSKISYYKKTVKEIPSEIDAVIENKTSKKLPMFKFKVPKTRCSFDGCPFKSGNKPCLFYFEYKDGTASCPGKRFMKEGDKIGLEKGSD